MAAKYEKVRIYEILYEMQMFSYIRKKFVFRSRGGFTLIETVVALAVILAAVVGPTALVSRGLFNFSFSKNKIIAANLAQESIELVRLVRDNNIMCDKLDDGALNESWKWDRDPHGPGGGDIRGDWRVDAADFAALSAGGAPAPCASLSSPVLSPPGVILLKLDTDSLSERFGLYNYSSGADTIFVRSITISKPGGSCGSSPQAPDCDVNVNDQLDVTSKVEWIERGIHDPACPVFESRCLTLQERLYNWK